MRLEVCQNDPKGMKVSVVFRMFVENGSWQGGEFYTACCNDGTVHAVHVCKHAKANWILIEYPSSNIHAL